MGKEVQKKAEQAAEEHVKVVSAAQSVVADTQSKVEEAVKKEEAEADKTVKSKMDEVKEKAKEVEAAKEEVNKTEQKAKVKAEVKEKVAKATMTNAEKYSLLKGKVVEAKKMVDTIIAEQSKIESSVGAAAASAKAATSPAQ